MFKALLVDDQKVNNLILKSILTKMSIEAECVDDGLEAVKICNDNQYDIIFMDIDMPGMDGITATQEIRSKSSFKKVPIVAVTCHDEEEFVQRAHAAGMNEYLVKPISYEKIKTVLFEQLIVDSQEA